MASTLLGPFPKVSCIPTDSTLTTTVWNKSSNIQNKFSIVTSPPHNLKCYYKGIKGGFANNEFKKKYLINATSTQSNEFGSQAYVQKCISESLRDGIHVFYKFSRPYFVLKMILSVISSSLLAVDQISDLSPTFFIGLLQYIGALFWMQMYNVGVNQLADLEIDKINKPHLPLASGQFPFKTAVLITVLFVVMSLGLGFITGSRPLLWILLFSFAVMSAYSINLPFLRWKRSTLLTMLYSTLSIIPFMVGPFLHMKTYVLKRTVIFSRPLIFSIMMMSFFCVSLAMLKDVPDIEGDKSQGIRTLAVQWGPKPVFWISVTLLEIAYGVSILVGATCNLFWSKVFTVLAHATMALILWHRAKFVDLKNKDDLQSFYMFCFKLIYVEYFLVPFVR